MQIVTENDFAGVVDGHPAAEQFLIFAYKAGGISYIPRRFFRTWKDNEPAYGSFYIGKCSFLGVDTLVKYDTPAQKLTVGRYVSCGLRARFLLNGQHETRTLSMCMFTSFDGALSEPPTPQYGDTVVKNDVWIGDEAMILGGTVIENGCIIAARAVIPPNFRCEPFGIYAGVPAKLKRFRFSEKLRENLVDLAWWHLPLSWVKENNASFLQHLTEDEGQSLEMLAELKRRKADTLKKAGVVHYEELLRAAEKAIGESHPAAQAAAALRRDTVTWHTGATEEVSSEQQRITFDRLHQVLSDLAAACCANGNTRHESALNTMKQNVCGSFLYHMQV